MAEPCPSNENNLDDLSNINRDSELPRQDCSCTSPSPTETVCLDSILCSDNAPGTSTNNLNLLDDCLDDIYRLDESEIKPEKTNSISELDSEKCDGEQSNDRFDNWEDCDDDLSELRDSDCELTDELLDNDSSDETQDCSNSQSASKLGNKKSGLLFSERILKKRKLDTQDEFPCKRHSSLQSQDLPDNDDLPEASPGDVAIPDAPEHSPPNDGRPSCSGYQTTSLNSTLPSAPSGVGTSAESPLGDKRSRSVIPSRDNLPLEMQQWLAQFQRWFNADRILAIDELIARCDPTQVRHMMQVIEPQFQRDFISLLPKELALKVLSFLEPSDLLRAAQTCQSWRILAEDNLLWKEKCRESGVEEVPKRRSLSMSKPAWSHYSPWKTAYLRHHTIEMNWRNKPIKSPKMLKGHDDHVITCLQFCGNRIVSGSDDNTLKVWSATTGKCLRTLVGHTGGVWSSQMSGNVIISGSTDRTLKVWDADTGVCTHTLYGHISTVRCMHLHGDRVVSGSRDATLRLWDIVTGQCLHVLVGHLAAVRCVQYDGRLVVSGAYDYMVKVWNPEREECLHTLQGHTNRVYSLQFDGVHVVSGSLDTSIRVWEVETGALKHTLMGHQSLTSGMELRNNILVSGNADSTVKVWDIITGQCLQTLSGPFKHQSAVTCLQFNSRFVITSSDDGTVKLWDVRTGDFIRNLVSLESGGSGGVVWRIRASDTKLVCAVGSRNGTEETKLLVLDFDTDCSELAR